jgi:hypothetical protein
MVNFIWTVVNLDKNVSDATILNWMRSAGVPPCLEFVFETPFANMWTLNTSWNGSVPFPVAPWTIIVSSGEDPQFKWTVAGMAVTSMHQAAVGHWSQDSQEEMGARMWHEILHCYDLPVDNMQTTEKTEFIEYMRTTGSPHYTGFTVDSIGYENGANHTQLLTTFYNYMMHKYLECECFQEGCGEQPDVPLEDIYVPSPTPSPNETVGNSNNNFLLLVGAAAALLLLL